MIVDIEKVTGTYLREHPALATLGARVLAYPPDKTDTPWVRVTLLDDPAVGGHRSDHLIEFMLQVDSYAGKDRGSGSDRAGGRPEASLLDRTVREALRTMPGRRGDAIITGVEFIGGLRAPDTDFEPARERYIRTVLVWAHS